jgi:hypothetical protein
MQKRLPLLTFHLVMIILCSCRNSDHNPILDVEVPGSGPQYSRVDRLARLVDEIASLDVLEGPFIGNEHFPSTQKDYARELVNFEDTASLVQLTNHKKPTVRIMSFKALKAIEYPELKKIFIEHLSDTGSYMLFSGCLILPERVNQTMFYTIASELNEFELVSFETRIKESLKGLSLFLL